MNGKVDVPTIFLDQEWWIKGIRPKDILSQKFATVLSDEDLSDPNCRVVNGFLSRPRMPASVKASGLSEWKIEDGEFQISVELDEFEKEELSVKKIGRYVEIHGKHGEKRDQYGLVSREFRRRFRLPDNCDIGAVASSFSTDCKLTITAPVIRGQPGEYNGPLELPLHHREYNTSRTEIDQEEFAEIRERCQNIYDEILETDRMNAELAAYFSERGIDGMDLDEFRRRWSSLKKKQTEPNETEIDVEIQEHIKIMDSMVQETIDMFTVNESPKAPVEPSGTGSPKAPVEPSGTESPKAPVEPKNGFKFLG